MTQNLEDFKFGNVLSKYPSIKNFPVELVYSHGASHRKVDKWKNWIYKSKKHTKRKPENLLNDINF